MRNLIRSLSAAALLMAMTAPAASAAEPNTDSSRVSVYSININRMDRAWKDWVEWIKSDDGPTYIPDIILVQDMDTTEERLRFQRYLEKTDVGFGGDWQGRQGVAGANGWHTAVIWRAERFEVVDKRGWWGFGDSEPKDGTPRCVDEADTSTEDENGSPAVQVRLLDTLAERHVSAVSFKTSGKETPKTCAWKNMRKVNFKLSETDWTGDMMVMGTDANSSDRVTPSGDWRCWYRGSNIRMVDAEGNLESGCFGQDNQRFYDPIFEKCEADETRTVEECLNQDHATRKDIRIDFMFVKLTGGAEPVIAPEETDTLPWRSAPGNEVISDHRGLRTLISY